MVDDDRMFSIVEVVDENTTSTLKSGLDSLLDARKMFGEFRFAESNQGKVLRLLNENSETVLTNEKPVKPEKKRKAKKKKEEEEEEEAPQEEEEEPEEPKKKKPKKMTGYNLFMKETRIKVIEELSAEEKAMSHKEKNGIIMSRVGSTWKALNKAEKEEWNERAKEATAARMEDDDDAKNNVSGAGKKKQQRIIQAEKALEKAEKEAVEDQEGLLERMEADDWTILEAERADGKGVIKTYQFGLKKYRSLLEVARHSYPEFLNTAAKANLPKPTEGEDPVVDEAMDVDDAPKDETTDEAPKDETTDDNNKKEETNDDAPKDETTKDETMTDVEKVATDAGADDNKAADANTEDPMAVEEPTAEEPTAEEPAAEEPAAEEPSEDAPVPKDDDEEQEFN